MPKTKEKEIPLLKSRLELEKFLRASGVDSLPGLNVQEPWASLLLSGKKTIETRTYPCTSAYLLRPIGIVATRRQELPKSCLIGLVTIEENIEFDSLEKFRAFEHEHLVAAGSQFDWKRERPKWGWRLTVLALVAPTVVALPKRGIVWTKEILAE